MDRNQKASFQNGSLQLIERISKGELKVASLVETFISAIESQEKEIGAWTWFDVEFARKQAKSLDVFRSSGKSIGRLHGIPVGIKDIIDTDGIPTENGSKRDKGRVPTSDAWIVQKLKSEGALLMGKTVTTDLAYLDPGKTRNPRAFDHTPGGSSSGSAAAVAAGMVPLAIGTQTGGSVIRPAAYCGVTGFKPSFGAIPRTGVLRQSQSLDTVGVFGLRPEDCALLGDVLFGFDELDSVTRPNPNPKLLETTLTDPPVKPTFAFIQTPNWAKMCKDTVTAFGELKEFLGEEHCFEIGLPAEFDDAEEIRKRINFSEMARNFYTYIKSDFDSMGKKLQEAIKLGSEILAKDYLSALDWKEVLYSGLEQILERADAIIMPSSPTPAPKGLESTGDGILNGVWTLVGAPVVTIPGLTSSNELPIGIQLIGARDNDARLLRTSRWLLNQIEEIQ